MTIKSTRSYGIMGTKFSGKMARPRQMIGRDTPPPPEGLSTKSFNLHRPYPGFHSLGTQSTFTSKSTEILLLTKFQQYGAPKRDPRACCIFFKPRHLQQTTVLCLYTTPYFLHFFSMELLLGVLLITPIHVFYFIRNWFIRN